MQGLHFIGLLERRLEIPSLDSLLYSRASELDPVIDKTLNKEQVAEIMRIKTEGRPKEVLALISDKMVNDLTISGTPQDCRNRIKKLGDHAMALQIIRVSVQPFKESKIKEEFKGY
jgi:hypothetical protein